MTLDETHGLQMFLHTSSYYLTGLSTKSGEGKKQEMWLLHKVMEGPR